MKRLVVKTLPSLFISMVMTSSVLCGRLAAVSKIDNNRRTPDTKNSTEEDYNQDVAGIRRAAPPANIFLNPNHQCYLQYFLNGQPPVNLRIATLPDMRYICQQLPNNPGTYFYASMHDEGAGIPVYSAYVLRGSNVNFQAQAGTPGWIQTPGIQRQGSPQVYAGTPCHRGHLFAAMTASGNPQNAANSVRSTYQYTNAVPQCAAFNTGQWRVFEGRIRNYARNRCIPLGGRLYLISGIAYVAIQNTNPPQPIAVPITQLNAVPPHPAIDRPGSMWTAGMCLFQNNQGESFAVIGNNVPNPPGMLTQETSVTQLEAILQFDIQTNNLKRDRSSRRVKLFPGLTRSHLPIDLPPDEYPPTDRSSRRKKTPPGPSSSRPNGRPSERPPSSSRPNGPKSSQHSSKRPVSPPRTSSSRPSSSRPPDTRPPSPNRPSSRPSSKRPSSPTRTSSARPSSRPSGSKPSSKRPVSPPRTSSSRPSSSRRPDTRPPSPNRPSSKPSSKRPSSPTRTSSSRPSSSRPSSSRPSTSKYPGSKTTSSKPKKKKG